MTRANSDRRQRGQELAASVTREGDLCRVPSSKGGFYLVNLLTVSCTCPDFTYRHVICKHMHAARFFLSGKAARKPVAIGENTEEITDTHRIHHVPKEVRS